MRYAACIKNRGYSQRTKCTPYELFYGKKPNLIKFNMFGSHCFAYIEQKTKLQPRSEKGIFLGHDPQSPANLVFFPGDDILKRVRIIKCFKKQPKANCVELPDESYVLPPPSPKQAMSPPIHEDAPYKEPSPDNEEEETPICHEESDVDPEFHDCDDDEQEHVHDSVKQETQTVPRRSTRICQKPKHLQEYITDSESDDPQDSALCVEYCYKVSSAPKTYQEAVSSPKAGHWKKAMDDEIAALRYNNTYELTDLPAGRSVVGGRWVYDVKRGPTGEEAYKARYVAKGYSQVPELDYKETFSPTARMTSVRLLMQFVAGGDYHVHQLDFKNAYLQADIDVELYVQKPEGYSENVFKNDENENIENNKVWRLKKSLYGLKQSGRNWNSVLSDFLIKCNFTQSLSDNCLYRKTESNFCVIIIVFVDDLIIVSNSSRLMNEVKDTLHDSFNMRDLGQLSWFLGIEFKFINGSVRMCQSQYVDRLLNRFGLADCKPKSLPCDMSTNKNDFSSESTLLEDLTLFREIVGSLIYLMTCTRPDLSFVVNILAQSMSKPTVAHLSLAKFALRYLKGTASYGLTYNKSPNIVYGFCDGDWGNLPDRRSISGYCFKLESNSSPVSWRSRKQPTVALSSCEAEFVSLAFAVQEAMFLRQLIVDMTGCNFHTVNLLVDNQGAIAISKNPVQHQRSKHISIKYHFVRTEIKNNVVSLTYIESDNNIADLFTKPVSRAKLLKFDVCH